MALKQHIEELAAHRQLTKNTGTHYVDIAEACYEANRAYAASLGDNSFGPWKDAPDWQKETNINGVLFHLKNLDASPGQSHESWMAEKVATGWKLGPVKDPEKKEHPCMVPYEELPAEQRFKDSLFIAIVHALRVKK